MHATPLRAQKARMLISFCAHGPVGQSGLQHRSGWSDSICALAIWCNGSTPDFGSGDIGSTPMNAASHSSNGQDSGFLILQCGFESCMRLTDSHSAEKNVIPEKHLILCLVGSMARTGDFQSSDTGSVFAPLRSAQSRGPLDLVGPVRGLWVCSKSAMHRSFKPREAGSTPVMPIV